MIPPGKRTRDTLFVIGGVLTVIAGIIIFPLPGPMGTPIILFGIALIVTGNRRAASRLRLARSRRPRLHTVLVKLEERLRPGAIRAGLARTNRARRS